MTENCIAIFAKTPSLSPVKTRLAHSIGGDKAEKIYGLCVDSLQETLCNIEDIHITWALAEEEAQKHIFWKEKQFEKIWTGKGELGTRLHNVYSTLKEKYTNVILIGTDSPQLSIDAILNTIKKLKQDNAVIGPTHDGGYYLFGSSLEISKSVWEGVQYSTEDTRRKFIKKLKKEVIELETLSDLDTVEDISRILNEMPEKKNKSQEKLIDYLRKI